MGAAAASSPVLYSFDFIVFHRILVQSLVGFLALGTTFLNAGPDFFYIKVEHILCVCIRRSPFGPVGPVSFAGISTGNVSPSTNSLSLWKIVAMKELALPTVSSF